MKDPMRKHLQTIYPTKDGYTQAVYLDCIKNFQNSTVKAQPIRTEHRHEAHFQIGTGRGGQHSLLRKTGTETTVS